MTALAFLQPQSAKAQPSQSSRFTVYGTVEPLVWREGARLNVRLIEFGEFGFGSYFSATFGGNLHLSPDIHGLHTNQYTLGTIVYFPEGQNGVTLHIGGGINHATYREIIMPQYINPEIDLRQLDPTSYEIAIGAQADNGLNLAFRIEPIKRIVAMEWGYTIPIRKNKITSCPP